MQQRLDVGNRAGAADTAFLFRLLFCLLTGTTTVLGTVVCPTGTVVCSSYSMKSDLVCYSASQSKVCLYFLTYAAVYPVA